MFCWLQRVIKIKLTLINEMTFNIFGTT